jgi:hypothetical protein
MIKGALKWAVATIAEISLRARLKRAACLRIIQPEPSEEDGTLWPPIGAGSQAFSKP